MSKLFTDLQLSPQLQTGVKRMGFEELTPIQDATINLLLEGRDVIGQAQTGTGKTASFGLPLLMKMKPEESYTQALVLAPTRELVDQITSHLRGFGKMTEIRIVGVHGGVRLSDQLNMLSKPPHVVVGTPGRLIDLVRRRRVINLSKVKVVVLDEADKMLELGFIKEVHNLLSRTPFVRQTSLWSATISFEVLSLATRYMRAPRKVLISQDDVAQVNVDQYYMDVTVENRLETLYYLLNTLEVNRGIIFCNTRKATEELAEKLKTERYRVRGLHGRYTQEERNQVINDLKRRRIIYVVSTDIASRGLDIRGITHIINYEVPEDTEVYFHRIGRTARLGKTGVSITLVIPESYDFFEKIEEMNQTEIKRMDNPLESDM